MRKHFQEQVKAALPTRRPYVCPEPTCPIEGKDWQVCKYPFSIFRLLAILTPTVG